VPRPYLQEKKSAGLVLLVPSSFVHSEVLDFLRANPRYILSIGSTVHGAGRDARLAQYFF